MLHGLQKFVFLLCRKPMTWSFKWGKFVQKDFEGRGYLQVLIGKVDPGLRLQSGRVWI